MKTEIITISELQDYIKSDFYKNSEVIPISPERAISYIQNPRASSSMPVLFKFIEDDQIIAFRTLLPDYLYSGKNKISFAWLSGNFVSPDQRRKGLSSKLFRIVEEAWEGKVMYTNYAPASKAVYDKSGVFEEFLVRPGRRYYLRSSMAMLLNERINSPVLLKLSDQFINAIHDLFISKRIYALSPSVSVEEIQDINRELETLINVESEKSLFRRAIVEFEWIRKHPWVTNQNNQDFTGQYQFTHNVKNFLTKWIKIKSSDGIAFIWISIIDEKLSIPYYYQDGEIPKNELRKIIINELIANHCSYISLRDFRLNEVLNSKKRPFLFSKDMPQRYFAHKSLLDTLPDSSIIYDGDGDCVFT